MLCTGAILQVHWTDKSTGAGIPDGDQLRLYRRERLHRASLANKILCHYGLKVEEWNGSKYLLSDRKGRQEIIDDLGGLWPAAEKLAGYTLNPLDTVLIAKLKQDVC
ncbi:hypothetical protein ACD591_08795 [Rufibacter glacialis]|uniref:Uncharacterized protein n=1 Tax=Rufibacter glacialis TaxID=1259555 RepID=A0ABV4RG80_9BACT|nr:hypothetical protein [Rufibacter glacialis]